MARFLRRKPRPRDAQPSVAFTRPAHTEGCFRWNPGEIVIGHGRPCSRVVFNPQEIIEHVDC
jgi:hypothetical protein